MRAVAYPSMAAAPVRRRHEAGCSATIVRTSSAIAATEPNPTAPAMVTSRSMFSFAALSVLFIFDSLPRRFPWGFILALSFAFLFGVGLGLMRR